MNQNQMAFHHKSFQKAHSSVLNFPSALSQRYLFQANRTSEFQFERPYPCMPGQFHCESFQPFDHPVAFPGQYQVEYDMAKSNEPDLKF